MNPGHMKLGLKAISYGIDKIPDSAWEAIPAFRPKDKDRSSGQDDQQDSKKQSSRRRSHRDSDTRSRKDSDRRSSPSDNSGSRSQYQKPSNDYYVNSQYSADPRNSNRGDSVSSTNGNNRPQFSDPFEQDQARGAPQDATQLNYQNTYQPPSQNPYQPASRDTAQPPPVNEPYWLQQERQWQQPDSTPQQSRSLGDQQMQSSDTYLPPPPPQGGSHRYNPADYQPRYDDGYDGGRQGGQQYLTAPPRQGGRSSSAGPPQRYGGYDDDYDNNDRDYDDRVARRGSSKKKHGSRDESDERGGPRGFVDKNFDKSDKGLQYGALGAVAGGFIGHKFGKGPLATLAGAVVGGVGANAWEAREARHKDRDHEKAHKYRSRSTDYTYPRDRSASRGARDDEYSSAGRRGGYDRDDSYYSGREDDYSDDDRRRGGENGGSRSRRRSGGRDRDYDDRDYR